MVRPAAGPRDERGAVLPIVAALVTVMITVAAFAVDLGVQRVVRRDMQALADIVAIDLARELDGRARAALAGEVTPGSAGNALGRSLARNDDTIGEDLEVLATWGAWDGTTFDATADPPTAVRVVASATTDFAFVDGDGSATRTAYAQADSTACYKLGSWAAAVRGGDSALISQLNRLVGLDLDLLSYRALAGADLRLSQLVAQPQIGTGARLLDAPIAYRDLLQASITALEAEKDPSNDAAVRALRTVLNGSAGTPAVTLGQVLGISADDSAALEADLDVLDLVLGSLMVANGEHALEIPNLQAGVPGVGRITQTTLAVWQGLTMACGTPGSEDTDTTSSQLRGQMELEFANLPSMNLKPVGGLFSGTLQTGKATGVLTVDLGGAQGRLVGAAAGGLRRRDRGGAAHLRRRGVDGAVDLPLRVGRRGLRQRLGRQGQAQGERRGGDDGAPDDGQRGGAGRHAGAAVDPAERHDAVRGGG